VRFKMSSAATAPIVNDQDERYYRIGEVSRLTGVPPFVLRFWEEELPMLEPLKSPAGYRLYRQLDVDLVMKIRRMLYDEGFTIAGVRRHLRDLKNGNGLEPAVEELAAAATPADGEGEAVQLNRRMLLDLRDALRSFLTLLERK